MKTLRNIIRENLSDKMCQLIHKELDKMYFYEGSLKKPKFVRKAIGTEGSDLYVYPLIFIVVTKTYYYGVINDMIKQIDNMLGFSKEESYECIKNYVDEKINKTHIMLFSDDENIIEKNRLEDEYEGDDYLEEAEEGGESGGGDSGESKGGGSTSGKEWESGLTRGPANPITYDSQWTGQRGWEGIKSLTTKRGKANPIE